MQKNLIALALIFISTYSFAYDLGDIARVGTCEYENRIRFMQDPCLLKSSTAEKNCREEEKAREERLKADCNSRKTKDECDPTAKGRLNFSYCKWTGDDPIKVTKDQYENASCLSAYNEGRGNCETLSNSACIQSKECILVAPVCSVDWHENGFAKCSGHKNERTCNARPSKSDGSYKCRWGAEVNEKNIPVEVSLQKSIDCQKSDLLCQYTADGITCDDGNDYKNSSNPFQILGEEIQKEPSFKPTIDRSPGTDAQKE